MISTTRARRLARIRKGADYHSDQWARNESLSSAAMRWHWTQEYRCIALLDRFGPARTHTLGVTP